MRKHGGPYTQFYQVYPNQWSAKLFLTDLWFQIVDQINASSDLLLIRYGGKAWFKELLKDLDWTIPQSPTVFEDARSEIDKSYDEFVIMLEGLAKDFYVQEVAYALLTSITYYDYQAESSGLTRTWLEVKRRVEIRVQKKQLAPPLRNDVVLDETLQRSSLESIIGSGKDPLDEINTAATKCINFLDRYNKHSKAFEETLISTYAERIQSLEYDLSQMMESKRRTESFDLDIVDLSIILRGLVIQSPISAQYLRFETNICKFCTMVTGNAGVGFQDVFKVLRDYLTWQKQHWTSIYTQIREQGAELARKQRVITSLGFRHVLETLPDQSKILAEFPGLTGKFGATGIWRLTWQLAVERKLIRMLQERVTTSTSSIAASSTSSTPSTSGPPSTSVSTPTASGPSSKSTVSPGVAATKPPSDPLREILQYDLEYWISNLKRDKAGNTALTTNASRINTEHRRLTNLSTSTTAGPDASVASGSSSSASPAAAASSSAASTSGPTTGKKKSTHTQLFIDLGLDYASWNGFQRGLGLYSELSGSIHKYSQTFEVLETDWARNDWLVLQWLKPELNENGEVVWNDTRKRMGLPFTP